MRTTQFMGFTPRGEEFIKELKIKYAPIEYNNEGQPVDVIGMFGELIYLCWFYYEGTKLKYHEYIQADPWSSGPCIFMAIWDDENNCPVKETLWDEKEIENV